MRTVSRGRRDVHREVHQGLSAVESILALDRLRQEVIIKEKLTSKGRMRKTSSVPNFGTVTRGVESSPSINSLVEEDFR
ncbi:putative kinesin-like protein KIF13A isoform X2, partial [Apostichopus japonicus]